MAPLPKGKKKIGDFKHHSTKNLCEGNELNKMLRSFQNALWIAEHWNL